MRAVLVARPTFWGPGIAHHYWTSKLAEASRRICYTPTPDAHTPVTNGIYISKLRHLLFATSLTVIFEIFQVSERQERASSKRFPKCLGEPNGKPVSLCRPYALAHDRIYASIESAIAKLAYFLNIDKDCQIYFWRFKAWSQDGFLGKDDSLNWAIFDIICHGNVKSQANFGNYNKLFIN